MKLYINGKDARATWGVVTEDSSTLSALMTPAGKKERISNDNTLENGSRYITSGVKVAEREVSLPLQFTAPTENEFLRRYKAFCDDVLTAETIEIQTTFDPGVVYKFIYESCTQFTQYYRFIAKFTLKLVEPDPTDRSDPQYSISED